MKTRRKGRYFLYYSLSTAIYSTDVNFRYTLTYGIDLSLMKYVKAKNARFSNTTMYLKMRVNTNALIETFDEEVLNLAHMEALHDL